MMKSKRETEAEEDEMKTYWPTTGGPTITVTEAAVNRMENDSANMSIPVKQRSALGTLACKLPSTNP